LHVFIIQSSCVHSAVLYAAFGVFLNWVI